MNDDEINVNVVTLEGNAHIIRVPGFVESYWRTLAPGAQIGVWAGGDVLSLKPSNTMPIEQLRGKPERITGCLIVGSTTERLDETLAEVSILGKVATSTTFLPNLLDPTYRQMIDQHAMVNAEAAEKSTKQSQLLSMAQARRIEQSRLRGNSGGDDNTLFKYYRNDEDNETAIDPREKAQSNMQAASHLLFKMFETNEEIEYREIQQSLNLPHNLLVQLLDRLTDTPKERLGKRSAFRLKPQFRTKNSGLGR